MYSQNRLWCIGTLKLLKFKWFAAIPTPKLVILCLLNDYKQMGRHQTKKLKDKSPDTKVEK